MRSLSSCVSHSLRSVAGSETTGQFRRFLLVGLANTFIGCAVYLAFVSFLSHTLAYGIAFVAGTASAATLHARITYGVPLRRSSFALTAMFYLISYLANAAVLELVVRGLGIDKRMAILAVVAVSVPITFFVTRIIYKGAR